MIGASFLSGAHGRLLPPSIPFRFFTAAMFFYVLFWGALLYYADDLTSYMTGGGPVLGTIHVATLGVLTMTVIGAALQLLSVATRRAFKRFWLCRLVSWIYIPGFMLLVYGMFVNAQGLMLAGAGVAGAGLMLFFYLIIDNIRGVTGMTAIMIHCWAAMISLLGLVALGILSILNMQQGFMPDHMALVVSHMVLALFGFMSLLAMGFSYILMPMFALSPAASEKTGRLSVTGCILALVMIVVAVNIQSTLLALTGVTVGLAGVGLYLVAMRKVYMSRMRKRLGIPFLLIRTAWVMLPVTLIWGGVGFMGYWPETGHVLFGLLAIVGWLQTFLVGVLHRILPFLSSMHTSGSGGVPMLASSMANDAFLKINAAGHLGGFVTAGVGILLDQGMIIRAGALLGLVGAFCLLGYLLSVVRHMIIHRPIKA